MLPRAAADHYAEQRRIMAAVLGVARRLWGVRPPGDFEARFDAIAPTLVAAVVAAQGRAVADADVYTAAVLDELGTPVDPEVEVNADLLTGVASDGRELDSLIYGAVIHAKGAIARGQAPPAAWEAGRSALLLRVQTQVADASRQAVGLSVAARPRVGSVRMLNPPSCSRCAVLAGRWYRYNAGFRRHPGCDCRAIPSTEATAGDLTVDPRAYFDSLTEAEQSKIFTRSGAEAIRSGADVAQIVNARRGMYTASAYGRSVLATREGVTRRGLAYQSMSQAAYVRKAAELRSGRYRSLRAPRVMPETLQQIAESRDDYLRLLKLYGYIQ
ncbi:MAG: hypothetical protein ACI39C_07410 [Dietzia sp.]